MTARIEIGRLSAKDLGKIVELHSSFFGRLAGIEHRAGNWTEVWISGEPWRGLPSDTLIEITGTPSKENNA